MHPLISVARSHKRAGTGHHWLLKAQKHLSIIHREEASSSSGTSSGRTSDGRSTNGFAFGVPHAYTQQEDDAAAARATADAEARSHTPSYVEARALLVPATDLLSTAVDTASRQGTVSGALFCLVRFAPFFDFQTVSLHLSLTYIHFIIILSLLQTMLTLASKAAEAYMSLGNVSSARVGEQQFAQAIRYLRQARAVPGYVLAPYLQQSVTHHPRAIHRALTWFGT